MIRPKTA